MITAMPNTDPPLDDSIARPGDPNFEMYPPLRSTDDRKALVEVLGEGVIDPYLGRTMHGKVAATIYRGRVTHEAGS